MHRIRPIKEVSQAEFFALFDPEIHEAIKQSARGYKSEYMACYECLAMDSSNLGARSAMGVGPNNTVKTLAGLGAPLGQTPSQFLYPGEYCKTEGWIS